MGRAVGCCHIRFGGTDLRRAAWAAILVACCIAPFPGRAAPPTSVEPGVIEKDLRPLQPNKGGRVEVWKPILPGAPKGAAEIHLTPKTIEIVGSTYFTQAQLQAFAAPLIGKNVTLADVFAVAEAITKAYSDAGYPLSLAFVPAQEIKNGRVRIQIVEGYVAQVEISGNAGASGRLLKAYGEKIKSARPLTKAVLERYLLLANELPGLSVHAVFDRGEEGVGGVKLILVTTYKATDAGVSVNNRGSRAVGPQRMALDFTEFGNLTGRETIRLNLVKTLKPRELSYFYAGIETLLGLNGTKLGLIGTVSHARPGLDSLVALGFRSVGHTATLELSHPFVRSRAFDLELKASFEADDLRSYFGVTPHSHDKMRVLRGDAHFDFPDSSGGLNDIDVLVSRGLKAFGATADSDPLKSRPNGSSSVTTLAIVARPSRPLTKAVDLTVSFRAQAASRVLLASEQCGYGGSHFGRGFDSYEISGENCASGLIELRYKLPLSSDEFSVRSYGFYDAGVVRAKGTLLPGEKRQETGQSIGAGLRYQIMGHIKGTLEYAQPLTRDVGLEGNRDARVFFSINLSK